MYLVYTFLLYAGLLLTLPWYALKFRKYFPTLKDRLGYLQIPTLQRSVWIHAVSVGEVKSVRKLIEKLRSSHSDQPLVLSTITPAGQKLARSTEGLADHIFYFPLDVPGAIRRTLDRVNPELVLIAETEIWPNFLRECRKRNVRVVMVNGRISDRSFPRYRVVRRWLKRVLDDFTLLGMQTETDRERIESIGADGRKVTVFGNLKYDALDVSQALAPDLSNALALFPKLWIAASTMRGEEEQILDAFASLRAKHPDLALLVAPRHPERFDEVEQLIRARGFRYARRSRLARGRGCPAFGFRRGTGIHVPVCERRFRRWFTCTSRRAQHPGARSFCKSDRLRSAHGKFQRDSGHLPRGPRGPGGS